jgi:hypothetical protein
LAALNDVDRQIARFEGSIVALREARLARSTRFNEDLEQLLDDADDLARKMAGAQNSEDVRAVADLYPRFTRSLTTFERQLRGEIRATMDREFGGLLTIGRVFESIEGTAALGVRLVSCAEEARVFSDTAGSERLAPTIRRLREARVKLEAERASEAKDPEVGAFLDALVDGKASLRLVTTAVREWLEEHGALDNFVVRGA